MQSMHGALLIQMLLGSIFIGVPDIIPMSCDHLEYSGFGKSFLLIVSVIVSRDNKLGLAMSGICSVSGLPERYKVLLGYT